MRWASWGQDGPPRTCRGSNVFIGVCIMELTHQYSDWPTSTLLPWDRVTAGRHEE